MTPLMALPVDLPSSVRVSKWVPFVVSGLVTLPVIVTEVVVEFRVVFLPIAPDRPKEL